MGIHWSVVHIYKIERLGFNHVHTPWIKRGQVFPHILPSFISFASDSHVQGRGFSLQSLSYLSFLLRTPPQIHRDMFHQHQICLNLLK